MLVPPLSKTSLGSILLPFPAVEVGLVVGGDVEKTVLPRSVTRSRFVYVVKEWKCSPLHACNGDGSIARATPAPKGWRTSASLKHLLCLSADLVGGKRRSFAWASLSPLAWSFL